jgi:hypothetical protein
MPQNPDEAQLVRENPLSCQWGHLEFLLVNYRTQFNRASNLLPLVASGRRLRNELAHSRPVPFSQYANFRMELPRID